MTNEEILQTFSDINHAYNNSTKYDTLKRMLDELTEPCGDCISRKALLEEIENGIKAGNYEEGYEEYPHINDMDDIIECIKYADSVQPKPKTGHWIKVTNGRGGHECDLCHEYAPSYQSGEEHLTNYCPNCGAKMIEQQGSEE